MKYLIQAALALLILVASADSAQPPPSWPYIVLTPGSTPGTLNNGTLWTTTAGLFARINGSTVGPYSTGAGTPANPTATAGPTAVNGSASTYMRSDGAPAVQKGTNAQFGIVEGDGQSITCVLGVCSATAPNNTFTSNHTIAATDMGGQVNMNGSSLTATIPAISSTVLAAGMSVTITNFNSSALTISSTPTINGFSGTSIPQYGGINCVSNGTSLDCIGLGALAVIPNASVGAAPLSSGTSLTFVAPRKYLICTGTCTVTVPVPAAGYEFCVQNDVGVSTVITLSAIGSSAMYGKTDQSAYGTAGTGTFVSGGAAGDKVCLLGRDGTHYNTASFNGTWTAN